MNCDLHWNFIYRNFKRYLNGENAVREGGFEDLCVTVWEYTRVSCNISLRTLRNDSNECYAVSLQYLRIETVKRLAVKKVLRLVLFEIDIWICVYVRYRHALLIRLPVEIRKGRSSDELRKYKIRYTDVHDEMKNTYICIHYTQWKHTYVPRFFYIIWWYSALNIFHCYEFTTSSR